MALSRLKALSGGGSATTSLLLFPLGLLLLLNLLLPPQVLASPTRHDQHGKVAGLQFPDDHRTPRHGAGSIHETNKREGSCRGWLDVCCHASVVPSAHRDSSHDRDQTWPGNQGFEQLGSQKPLTAASYRSQADSTVPPHHRPESPPSASTYLTEATMGLFRPLLALAAGAWCASSSPTNTVLEEHDDAISPSLVSSKPCGPRNVNLFPSFANMSHIFSFGDSYTGTDFKFNEIPFPSRNFPLGNPPYPGRTSANGPNWIDYLTVKYNQSFIKTYNLAAGGATANPEMVPPGFPSVFSLRGQIVDAFIPGYSHRRIHGHDGQPKAPGYPHWLPQNTLFIIWMGINDVNGGFPRGPSGPGGTDALNKRTFKEYAKMLDLLHQHGAANFAILNVPAIERSPHIRSQGAPAVAMARRDLLQFNGMLWDMLRSFKAKHKDKANVFVYDVYKDWNTVIDHPQAFKQTARLKNTMDYCAAYQFGTPTPDYFDPACGVPANQYLWSNAMHPTDRIHELVAARIPEILLKGDQDLC